MKPTFQITFDKLTDFQKVRNAIEGTHEFNHWRYGQAGTRHFIQFLRGTTPGFFVWLGGFLKEHGIKPDLS